MRLTHPPLPEVVLLDDLPHGGAATMSLFVASQVIALVSRISDGPFSIWPNF
jgi:hypothetical protein